MGREADLLRMLEPVVRPGGLPNTTRRVAQPIEGQDFESLLAEAAAEQKAEPQTTAASERTAVKGPDPLQGLTGVDRIENAALRRIIGGATSAS